MAEGPDRVVVISSAQRVRAEVSQLLATAGVVNQAVDRVALVGEQAPPDLIIICGPEPALLCTEVRDAPSLAQVPILALVPALPLDAAATSIASGATDVLVGTPNPAVLGNRVRNMVLTRKATKLVGDLESSERALLEVQRLLAAGGDSPETLRHVLLSVLGASHYDRASLIAHVEGSATGYVIAATDDPHLTQFALSMADYPELSAALQTREPLIVPDVAAHEITKPLADTLRDKGIGSLAVLPVLWRGQTLGAVFLRRKQKGDFKVLERDVRFGQLLASLLAATLRHGDVLERLRDQTRRISRASYEAERRLRTIESLKEHFEASADGVVVLDDEGRMLFVNGTAEAITGFARDGLIGSGLTDLVHPADREPLQMVIRSVLAGTNLEAFDLDLVTTGGGSICVSVTTSTVLSRSGAVILSFRDVTAQRSLESELEQTKDFLEKLIDSAVDAIIASDMEGRVVVFNSGAERIYGYRAKDVLGKLPVSALYPEGAASQVLRMLRSPDFGGVGRLEQTRREILSVGGELIPVDMSASIIYDDGREVATVGIFTDLRDRLRMEERLESAQRQLAEREKQAAIAELAGAAAHELNQPLTSIMATASMLDRAGFSDDPGAKRRLNIIVTEAERMAELVRKIGRIVRYETKAYVGGASILDLDASSHRKSSERAAVPEPIFAEPKSKPLPSPPPDDELTDELPGPKTTREDEITAEHRRGAAARALVETARLRPIDVDVDPTE